MRRLALVIAGAAALVAASPALPHAQKTVKPTVLIANVGKNDGYAMTLTKKGVDLAYGTTKRGPYTIYVHDYSDIHNLRIKGPGINKWTTVQFVGSKVWKINLRKGTYTVICDPHPVNMRFTFKVT